MSVNVPLSGPPENASRAPRPETERIKALWTDTKKEVTRLKKSILLGTAGLSAAYLSLFTPVLAFVTPPVGIALGVAGIVSTLYAANAAVKTTKNFWELDTAVRNRTERKERTEKENAEAQRKAIIERMNREIEESRTKTPDGSLSPSSTAATEARAKAAIALRMINIKELQSTSAKYREEGMTASPYLASTYLPQNMSGAWSGLKTQVKSAGAMALSSGALVAIGATGTGISTGLPIVDLVARGAFVAIGLLMGLTAWGRTLDIENAAKRFDGTLLEEKDKKIANAQTPPRNGAPIPRSRLKSMTSTAAQEKQEIPRIQPPPQTPRGP